MTDETDEKKTKRKMVRLNIEISPELRDRIYEYISSTWPREPHGKLRRVMVDAIEQYLEKNAKVVLKPEKKKLNG